MKRFTEFLCQFYCLKWHLYNIILEITIATKKFLILKVIAFRIYLQADK